MKNCHLVEDIATIMINNHNGVNYSSNNCFEVIYEDVLYTQARPEQNDNQPRLRRCRPDDLHSMLHSLSLPRQLQR